MLFRIDNYCTLADEHSPSKRLSFGIGFHDTSKAPKIAEVHTYLRNKALELAERFKKKERYFLDIFYQAGARMVNAQEVTNPYNAFKSEKAAQLQGRTLKAPELHAEFYHEYEAMTAEDKAAMVKRYDEEHKDNVPKMRRDTPMARIRDFSNTVKNIVSDDLHVLAGSSRCGELVLAARARTARGGSRTEPAGMVAPRLGSCSGLRTRGGVRDNVDGGNDVGVLERRADAKLGGDLFQDLWRVVSASTGERRRRSTISLFHPGTWFRILKNSEYIGTVKNAVAEKKQSVLRSAAQRRKAQY
ncbi:hypothetical protein B0H14DRAFT_3446923 [Mycena olivaceomarginata]|nr:hypothetical protein B0H14DRAFT_3446923 [Mycena olivaceomarginata]